MHNDHQSNDASASKRHQYQDLITIFDRLFADSFNTRLIKGTDEPVYLPAGHGAHYAQVVFAHGFYASALHEIAHWCLAGDKRREKEDYGYWYCPDGRNAQQQAEFEKVEVKPQAIEWAFCLAAGKSFQVSTDNLNGAEPDREGFRDKVQQQLKDYLLYGFPPRAQQFIDGLKEFYQTDPIPSKSCPVDLHVV
ncbi:elongation factor P hydroxylase [Neptunicella marina]|uniref:Elongation factor P hydroxylase n=2 Tax=Neptunicella marina TaxID=2125989 RepID=A0A8J6IS06_9ALTE|nr:elongation factor P hydroxylase [Neptunicella marina]MBC3764523.1 elongation factor P hydroxylase [Neptunicella marina]